MISSFDTSARLNRRLSANLLSAGLKWKMNPLGRPCPFFSSVLSLRTASRGGPVAPLPGDDLEFLPGWPDEDGLEDTLFLDRGNEVVEVCKGATRLMRIRYQEVEGDHPADGGSRTSREIVDEVVVVPHSSLR